MTNHISEAELRELVGQGLNFAQIAKKTGVNVQMLRQAACVLGVSSNSKTNNRSTGTVAEYLAGVSRGETLDAIGEQYGITVAAVRKALVARGMPTCARQYLKSQHTPTPSEAAHKAAA